MATLVLEVVRRLLEGTCPWMALYVGLDQGTVTPVYATPENVARVMRMRRDLLVRKASDAKSVAQVLSP